MRVQPHFPSRPLTVTSSSGAAFFACSAANSPAPPAPRMRMSVERMESGVIRCRRPPSPQGRARSRDRAGGVGIAAKRLPAPAPARGADVAVDAVPHPARGSRPESALPCGEGGARTPSRLDVLAAEAAGVMRHPREGGVGLMVAIGPELEILLSRTVRPESDPPPHLGDRLPVGPDLEKAPRPVEMDVVEHRHPTPEHVRQDAEAHHRDILLARGRNARAI